MIFLFKTKKILVFHVFFLVMYLSLLGTLLLTKFVRPHILLDDPELQRAMRRISALLFLLLWALLWVLVFKVFYTHRWSKCSE